MNKTFKEVLLFSGVPLGILLMICLAGGEAIIGAGILMLLVAGAYFIIGLVMLIASNTHMGKVLLLCSGIILLVGFSTCGLIMSGMSGMRFN
ncbi:MAG: hypothetical protein J7623_30030 [Chitinophaga sp.]|uniref:hypothetical protein n=1 Tax=Chitinophaga sp. TaxID=1869181 RepID=UPI001B0B00CA|nr:hypothetical protein [Chitinophaga sp.]MBO9732921.1 hypothetical protein [Chitinophaga sp.]